MLSPRRVYRLLCLLACAATVACVDSTADLPMPYHPPAQALTYAVPGDDPVRQVSGKSSGAHGCRLQYEQYDPVASPYRVRIIVAHGFMRNLKHMRGWAQHWSSWGLSTTVISLCNSTLLNGHHQRNADDLRHLAAQRYSHQPIIFAGFSAGGLAAWLAAIDYADTAAYLGLDPVDSGHLGQQATGRASLPGMVLYARPSLCNARNNFLPIAQAQPGYIVASIAGASHCHFESPYDRRCAWVCGGPSEQHTNASIQRHVRNQSTRWLLAIAANATGSERVEGVYPGGASP